MFLSILNLFSAASLFGVMARSGDRFLAVHLHLRYQELVTQKRVVVVVILVWVLCAFLLLFYSVVFPNISYIVFAILGVVYLVFLALIYFKIYFAVRRHRIQVHALHVAQDNQLANAARLRKSAVSVFYVYLVL